MEVFVITQEEYREDEHLLIEKLFKAGLHTLHIRKPDFSTEQLEDYIKKIPERYHKQLVLHSHHELTVQYKLKGIHLTENHRKNKLKLRLKLWYYKILHPKMTVSASYHKLSSLKYGKRNYDYVFFSPVFESISKNGHQPEYSASKMQDMCEKSKYRIVALGGVDATKIKMVKEIGFWGVALLGGIWQEGKSDLKLREIFEAI